MWRIIRAVVALCFLVLPALAEDAAVRKKMIDGLRAGNAEQAKALGVPNLTDLLFNRFPKDLDKLADELLALHRAGNRPDGARIQGAVARTLVLIQTRDGDMISTAPAQSVKAVIEALRSQMVAFSADQPELCAQMFVGDSAQRPSSQAIARASAVRMVALLTAIADGRDHAVAKRGAEDADYATLAKSAKARGVDTKAWSVLSAEGAKSAPAGEVCKAYMSWLDALMAAEATAGDRVMTTEALGLLTRDAKIYDNAIKQ